MAKINIVVDLGSKFLGLGLVDRDFVLREPCIVAEDKMISGNFLAAGIQALQKEKNDDYTCKIVYPVQNGEIVNPLAFEYLITTTLQKILPSHAFLPNINVYCLIACSTTNDTKRTIDEIFNHIGVKKVEFVLSAIGDAFCARKEFGLSGGITVNMGNNITQICAVDGDDVIAGVSMQWAGVQMLDKIIEYVRSKYSMAIGRKQANEIMTNCISLYPNNMSVLKIKGVNTQKNQEEMFEISSRELYETIFSFFEKIISVINSLLMSVSNFQVEKLRENGIILCGGLSVVEGLEKFFFDMLKLPIHLLQNPENSGVEGMKIYAKALNKR